MPKLTTDRKQSLLPSSALISNMLSPSSAYMKQINDIKYKIQDFIKHLDTDKADDINAYIEDITEDGDGKTPADITIEATNLTPQFETNDLYDLIYAIWKTGYLRHKEKGDMKSDDPNLYEPVSLFPPIFNWDPKPKTFPETQIFTEAPNEILELWNSNRLQPIDIHGSYKGKNFLSSWNFTYDNLSATRNDGVNLTTFTKDAGSKVVVKTELTNIWGDMWFSMIRHCINSDGSIYVPGPGKAKKEASMIKKVEKATEAKVEKSFDDELENMTK
jgi:hypothetical protein